MFYPKVRPNLKPNSEFSELRVRPLKPNSEHPERPVPQKPNTELQTLLLFDPNTNAWNQPNLTPLEFSGAFIFLGNERVDYFLMHDC